MTVADAKGILKGGDDAATEYLDKSSREQLRAKFLPIVKQATDEVGLVKQYNAFASQAATLGWSMRRAPTSRAMSPSRPSTGSSR